MDAGLKWRALLENSLSPTVTRTILQKISNLIDSVITADWKYVVIYITNAAGYILQCEVFRAAGVF
jgi:hypothetical protein